MRAFRRLDGHLHPAQALDACVVAGDRCGRWLEQQTDLELVGNVFGRELGQHETTRSPFEIAFVLELQ
ncbi:hypothetical protein D3C71_1273370 [compost metagenome]